MEPLRETSFQELVDRAAADILGDLMEGGGKKMKVSIHYWMIEAMQWNQYQKKNRKTENRS